MIDNISSAEPIRLTSVVLKSNDTVATTLHDEILIMTVSGAAYFHVAGVAARIWELVEQPTTVQSLCEQLSAEYRVEHEECRQHVMEFLDQLQREHLIVCQEAT
jgi:hypothetical protein